MPDIGAIEPADTINASPNVKSFMEGNASVTWEGVCASVSTQSQPGKLAPTIPVKVKRQLGDKEFLIQQSTVTQGHK